MYRFTDVLATFLLPGNVSVVFMNVEDQKALRFNQKYLSVLNMNAGLMGLEQLEDE